MSASRGLFITFEGGEGSGKSTQIGYLQERFVKAGYQVVSTREPGGTPGGEAVRELLVTGDPQAWSPDAEALLNYAARDAHIRLVIDPALRRGDIVLCDRFHDSTHVYQGIAGGSDRQFIEHLEDYIIGDFRPDLTFILDIDPEAGLKRAMARNSHGEDRFERMTLEYHQKIQQGFRQLAVEEPHRCHLINGGGHPDAIAEMIWEIICELTVVSDG